MFHYVPFFCQVRIWGKRKKKGREQGKSGWRSIYAETRAESRVYLLIKHSMVLSLGAGVVWNSHSLGEPLLWGGRWVHLCRQPIYSMHIVLAAGRCPPLPPAAILASGWPLSAQAALVLRVLRPQRE